MKRFVSVIAVLMFFGFSGCGNQMEAEYETLKAQTQELMVKKTQLEKKIDNLEKQVKTLHAENERLTDKLSDMEEQLQDTGTDNDTIVDIEGVEIIIEEESPEEG